MWLGIIRFFEPTYLPCVWWYTRKRLFCPRKNKAIINIESKDNWQKIEDLAVIAAIEDLDNSKGFKVEHTDENEWTGNFRSLSL